MYELPRKLATNKTMGVKALMSQRFKLGESNCEYLMKDPISRQIFVERTTGSMRSRH